MYCYIEIQGFETIKFMVDQSFQFFQVKFVVLIFFLVENRVYIKLISFLKFCTCLVKREKKQPLQHRKLSGLFISSSARIWIRARVRS